jgi:hypothetical protein
VVQEVDSSQIKSQRRRSERVSQSVPLIVRGIDLLGQPFEERTATVVFNLHGCRYSSKHHLPTNAWVTLEVSHGAGFHNVRARVAWVQRPQSIREFLQVAVELESAANIWGNDFPPEDWSMDRLSTQPFDEVSEPQQICSEPLSETSGFQPDTGNNPENMTGDTANVSPDSRLEPFFPPPKEPTTAGANPLLHEWTEELHRRARQAVESVSAEASENIRRAAEEAEQKRSATAEEFFQRWKEEFDRTQSGARDDFSAELAARQGEFLAGLTSKFEDGFKEARELIRELDQKTQSARAEMEAAAEAAVRAEQARNRTEAQGMQTPYRADVSHEQSSAIPGWKERVQSEMALAQSQWDELLQSSLDSGIRRLSEQLAERSREVLRSAEQKMTERFAELRQPLTETLGEARETLNHIGSALEHEMGQARSSLAEIEHVASRIKDYSSQLDASTHDTLNELHRRIENILESQTEEMNRRTENLVAGVSQRLNPIVESLGHQLVERTVSEVESRIAPHLERVPDLLRDLAAREMQVDEGLRLHRERLRQLSENNQREANAQMATTISALKNDLQSARVEALPKWNDDLNASGARAAQAAAESIRQNSEWFQQDAQARLQVMVEQTLTAAQGTCGEMSSQSTLRFGDELERRSSARIAGIEQQIDSIAHEVSGRARTQMDAAAEAAAASFGRILHGISEQEVQQFTYASQNSVRDSAHELERSAQAVLGNLSASAEKTVEEFRARMASQLEASVADGRGAVAAEFGALLNQFVAERDVRQQEWARGLERVSDEATEKHQDRLRMAADSWTVSSVRRLNEHGQNVIESLIRSADHALRDSCSRVFEGLAEMMRERVTNAAGAAGFIPDPNNLEMQENSTSQTNSSWTNA